MTTAAIIVAAGKGSRAGGGVPKQWRPVAGRTIITWTLEAFQRHPQIDQIVLVLNPDDMGFAQGLESDPTIMLAAGGATRSRSVHNGLLALQQTGCTRVLIHDVARPCVSARLISDVLDALETAPAAAPALAVTDALWQGDGRSVSGTQDRAGLFRAQTPQGFDYETIVAAHNAFSGDASDDVEVARAAGIEVAIVAGDEDNLKITTPDDFDRAARILRGNMDVRLGNGFDVHRFCEGDHVMLCGVAVPHSQGLDGHSDADVGMHAVTDAIYGALAMGDIGRHFPPSDPQWKGAASQIFLRHAAQLAGDMGFAISNVDCTLICEYPKVGPHAEAMQMALAGIMGIDPNRVSVKATTSERLGFTGREEGIAAIATATLVTK